jgi:hypothetical protein
MVTIYHSDSQPGGEYRKRLAFALQGAHGGHHYSSPELFSAVRDFVRNARHGGLSKEWVLVAIQDVIDAGVLPSLCDGERRAFSTPILRLAAEAYEHCPDAKETREASTNRQPVPPAYGLRLASP